LWSLLYSPFSSLLGPNIRLGILFSNTGEKRTLLNNILHRKANWIGHILRRNCLLHDAIEGQIMKVKGVGRRRRT